MGLSLNKPTVGDTEWATEINDNWTTLENAVPTGVVQEYVGAMAPTGWLLLQGGTIGDASSGGTARANADCEDLFKLLWDSMADAQAPVSGGRGASAAADWAAHKTITLPDARGRAVIGSGTGSGLTARTHGDSGGAETHQLTVWEMPSHTHEVPLEMKYTVSSGSNNRCSYGTTLTSSTGSDQAHNNMQRWFALNMIVKL